MLGFPTNEEKEERNKKDEGIEKMEKRRREGEKDEEIGKYRKCTPSSKPLPFAFRNNKHEGGVQEIRIRRRETRMRRIQTRLLPTNPNWTDSASFEESRKCWVVRRSSARQ